MSTETAFSRLGVPRPLAKALKAMRFTEPFEIQALTIPDALDGNDVLGRAPTGSGKTLAFGLPLLARISRAEPGRPTGLILAPTRELAEQIRREVDPLARSMSRSTSAVYGGKAISGQLRDLSRGVDLLVACPGRLLDLIEQGAVALDAVEVAVVDEADRMADMGFLPDVSRILGMTPPGRQTMLYSATLDNDVQVLIDTYQNRPVEHRVAELEPDLSLLTHRFIEVPKRDRIWLTADLVTDLGTTIVFSRTRHGTDRLARQLRQHGVKAAYIHGGRSQSQRDRALQLFTSGKVQVLVATDVAARGIHVDGVECVIHYDPPAEDKDYVHRSGRTARAGARGVVISLLDRPQVAASRKMQKRLGIDAGMEPTPERRHFLQPATLLHPSGRGTRTGSKKTAGSRPSAGSKRTGGSRSSAGSTKTTGLTTTIRQERSAVAAGVKDKPGSNSRSGRSRSEQRGEQEESTDRLAARRPPQRASSAAKKAGSGARKRSGAVAKGTGAGATSSSGRGKRAGDKPRSKRSGKPRPKNRKNKPGGGRSRQSRQHRSH